MPYPPPPWRLYGAALLTPRLVDRAAAHALVPPDVEVLPVTPGKALGCVYLATYGPGSDLVYHELIVAVLVRDRWRIGAWITHIYVDSPDSLAGGRDVWGLPKQLARFSWDAAGQTLAVRSAEQLICALALGPSRRIGRAPLLLPTLSQRGGARLRFWGRLYGRLGLGRAALVVPEASPVAALGMWRRGWLLHVRGMRLIAGRPSVIPRAAAS